MLTPFSELLAERADGTSVGAFTVAQAVAAGALTEPAQAQDFMARTGAQCLAVSIGNVHGTYLHPPSLDMNRLQEITGATSAPLSLHGASGIPDAMVRDAIAHGISKINVNTELRGAYLEATEAQMPQVLSGSQVATLHRAQVAAVERVVEHKPQAYDIGVEPA